jgi:hypothetical protein
MSISNKHILCNAINDSKTEPGITAEIFMTVLLAYIKKQVLCSAPGNK